MKALAITEPGRVDWVELDRPVAGPGELLLKVGRVGYCGSDLNTFRGLNPLVSYPRVPGHEIQATVAGLGTEVPVCFAVGQSVTVLPYTHCGDCGGCRVGRFNACENNQTLGVQREGALTQYVAVPHQKVLLAPELSAAALAMVEPLAVGFHAVDRGRVTADDCVLVFGCGMIGLGVIASAGLDRGAHVIAVDLDDDKLALARRAGASRTINTRTEDLPARLRALTEGRGPNVAIEAVGLAETFTGCVDAVGHAGRVVYVGYAKAPVAFETKQFLLKELDIMGSRGSTRADFERVIAMLQTGRYPVDATLTETVGFADAGDALTRWDADPAAFTKIQITLDD